MDANWKFSLEFPPCLGSGNGNHPVEVRDGKSTNSIGLSKMQHACFNTKSSMTWMIWMVPLRLGTPSFLDDFPSYKPPFLVVFPIFSYDFPMFSSKKRPDPRCFFPLWGGGVSAHIVRWPSGSSAVPGCSNGSKTKSAGFLSGVPPNHPCHNNNNNK